MRTQSRRKLNLAAAALLISTVGIPAQNIQITGRVLERAAMDPVPGATVKWNGGNPQTVTDAQGRFTLSGTVGVLPSLRFEAPYFRDGRLRIGTASANQTVIVKVYSAQGESIASHSFVLSPGNHDVEVLPDQKGSFFGFVVLTSQGQTYRLKVLHHGGPVPQTEANFVATSKALSKAAPPIGSVNASMTGLLPGSASVNRPDTNVGDIVLDYPARATIGIGATMPYGSTVLFDGSQGRAAANQELQSKWQDWPRFTPSATRQFRLTRDPQFLNDTSRVTLQSCCNTLWGYDDIQATVGKFQDAQVHVEFNPMGEYDNPYDSPAPNSNSGDPFAANTDKGYSNSGVYVASKYEIQIISFALTGAPGPHDIASIVDQYAATSNQNKANGTWQAYDITFRGARFNGSTMATTPYMTVWWNGVQIHNNRVVNAGASGLSNHSGEEHNDTTLYGLKLQSEGRDVRFRKVWIKQLKIDTTKTNFGY